MLINKYNAKKDIRINNIIKDIKINKHSEIEFHRINIDYTKNTIYIFLKKRLYKSFYCKFIFKEQKPFVHIKLALLKLY